MNKYFLHIGAPKTGTSSIQYFLSQNIDALVKQGFIYPKHLLDKNHISGGHAQDMIDEESCSQFIQKLEHDYHDKKILLSWEHMIEHPKRINKFIKNIECVIVYLRSQDQLLESLYNQKIKRHRETRPFQDFYEAELDKFEYKYSEVLQEWADLAGVKKICVIPYNDDLSSGNKILYNFLDQLGLGHDNFSFPEIRVNTSYQRDILEFKRLVNHLSYSPIALDIALQHLSDSQRLTKWPYSIISPGTRQKIMEHFEMDNLLLKETYSLRSGFPIVDTNEIREWQEYPGLSQDKVFSIVKYLVEEHPRVFARIRANLLIEKKRLKSNSEVLNFISTLMRIDLPIKQVLINHYMYIKISLARIAR